MILPTVTDRRFTDRTGERCGCCPAHEANNGQFVGRIAYITGEKALVRIVAKGSMRIISWSRVKPETFFKDRPDVELQLGHSFDADLARVLKSAWQSPR
jgi:hypothetical protein